MIKVAVVPGKAELFDLEKDPGEKESVANQHPEVVDDLDERLLAYATQQKMSQWMKAQTDFLGFQGNTQLDPEYNVDEGLPTEKPMLPEYRNLAGAGGQEPYLFPGELVYLKSASAAITTTAATATTLTGLGLVDGERPTVKLPLMHAFDRSLSGVFGLHFDESEAFAPARITILNHLRARDGAEFEKHLLERLARNAVGQIADVQFLTHEQNLLPMTQINFRGHIERAREWQPARGSRREKESADVA